MRETVISLSCVFFCSTCVSLFTLCEELVLRTQTTSQRVVPHMLHDEKIRKEQDDDRFPLSTISQDSTNFAPIVSIFNLCMKFYKCVKKGPSKCKCTHSESPFAISFFYKVWYSRPSRSFWFLAMRVVAMMVARIAVDSQRMFCVLSVFGSGSKLLYSSAHQV